LEEIMSATSDTSMKPEGTAFITKELSKDSRT